LHGNRVRPRCSGEQYDSDLGLYYLRARYYNPATGRFLSRDPNDPQLFDADGTPADPKSLHKYLYAGGDPVDGLDPSGRAVLIQYNFLGRVNQLAVHAAHHYWEVPLIGKLWCIHLQLLSYVAGVSGSAWRFQIPLPWCSAAGPF
jgi:RHS repeat-associated protein